MIAISQAAQAEIAEDMRTAGGADRRHPARPGRRAGRRADSGARAASAARSRAGPDRAGGLRAARAQERRRPRRGAACDPAATLRKRWSSSRATHAARRRGRAARARELGVGDALILPGWVARPTSRGSMPPPPASSSRRSGRASASPCWRRCGAGCRLPARTRRRCPRWPATQRSCSTRTVRAELAAAVARLLRDRDLAEELAQRGRARAAEFTWRRTAEETLASFERARRAA